MNWSNRSFGFSWVQIALLWASLFHSSVLTAAPTPQSDSEAATSEAAATEAAATEASELSEEEARQIKTTERFLEVLLKNPRYGTALDRVYGHHVEFGTLDKFLQTLKDRASSEADAGAMWMLLGLFESQRGSDAAAVESLQQAEQLRPSDALASYYLGQAQLRIGQSTEAIASFERAIERKPARADLLEIFQTLGRVHQRAQRTEQAMEVWQRLESLFPDDPRVLEQIAVTLAEEGQPGLALPRYQKLAGLVRDDYRKVVYNVTAAELTIKTGEREAGLKLLEKVLEDLNPESWLYRDVRRRIDDVFLRSGDQDSLVKYYQNWLASHPEDIEGMARLAKFLASSARVPEATQWMEKVLKLAPTRADLRKAFIDQLTSDQRYAEAIEQYEQLMKGAPGNTDYLRDWGKLVLRNRDVPEDERKREAVRIWNQILATRPDDALTVSQVADLFRQNKINDQAEQLYRKAVELAPNDPQYREYLGEFLHIQGRSEEALRIWAGIAEGTRRTAVNVNRLAEVYNSFGFSEQATVEIAEALKLDPKDFSLHIRAADYHLKAGKYDVALEFVASAEALAASDDERDAVIQQRIEVLQVSQRLDEVADELLAKLDQQSEVASADWYLAARYMEAARRWPLATEAIDKAIQADPKSIPALTVAARIAETSGDYGHAAQMNRSLAEIDRRSRSDHLMNVSRLEGQLGRADEALAAAQELIDSAPGNTDNYEFYAQVCLRFGRVDEGLDALRKAVRINPNEPHLIMALAAALADQLRTDEAIEVYWRAFDKSEEVEDKVGLTMKLTMLYQQINQLDKLIDRLERERREEDKRREMTICLAQAWQTAGDLGAARQELEGLLSEDTRDTNLLNQLAKLCEQAADPDAAVAYQRQLVAIAPGHETEFPLAGMLMANGQTDEAREIFVKLTQREEDPVRQMRALDSLITQGNFESAIGVIEPILAQNREDWELLYREGVAWASLDKKEEAINRFQRILALRLPYDSLGRSAAEKLKQAQAKAKSNNLRGISTPAPRQQSPLAMRSMASQVQAASGLIADNRYYGTNQLPPVWTPEAYGVARMAAWGWLLRFEDEDAVGAEATDRAGTTDQAGTSETDSKLEATSDSVPTKPSIVDVVREEATAENATRDAIYDWLYVAQLKSDFPTVFQIARLLAQDGGKEEYQFFLTSLKLRHTDMNQASGNRSGAASANKTALSDEDLQLARDCYTSLNDASKSVDLAALYGGNIAFDTNGQAYVLVGGSYSPLPGVFRGEGGYLTLLVEELRLAGHAEEALQLLNEHIAAASTASELAGVMSLLFAEERFDELPATLERWQQAALKQIADAPVTAPTRGSARTASQANSAYVLSNVQGSISQWLGKLGEDEENALVLTVLDRCLTVAEAEARHRRLVEAAQTRRTQQAVPTSTSLGRVSVYYGKKQTQATLNFPPVSRWLDRTGIMLLYQAHEVLKRNDVGSDLAEMLRKRLTVEAGDAESVDQSICNHLYLASALWWAEEQDEAVEQMASAAALAADDLNMQFSLAAMYETRGDFDEAASLLEKIVPRDQKLLQAIELRMLQLAERLGDTDRARTAAERLFGLRLDSQTQMSLVDRMQRLGLGSMADAILARAERTATNQTSSLASLMMLYQGQGKVEQANQLAHILLRKTTSPININMRSGRNPTRYRTQDSGLRTQALQLLHRSGGLKSLTTQLESQLERSPDSISAMQQLIEFYDATNQKEDVLRIVQQGLQVRPDSPMLRLQLAKQLEQSGKANEACDQYLELLKIRPDWVTDELYQIDRVFTQAKRKADLVDGLSKINLKQVSQPYYIFQTASGLLGNEETVEAGLKLMERAFDAFPSYRHYLTQNIQNEAIWKNDRFYEFAKRAVLPTPQDILSNPWKGLDQISSYSGNGEVNVFFHKMLQGLKSTDKLNDLENAVQKLLDQQAGWHGGRAMLALLELATDRKLEAQARLTEMFEDDAIAKSMPAEACWIIGQELDRFEDTRDLALTLFERAVSSPSTNSMNQLQYTPVAKLLDGFVRVGRTEDAKQLLLKQLSQSSFDQYDPSYASYQRVVNTTWAAQQLVKMNCPVDAMKLYRDLLDEPEQLSLASSVYSGGGGDQFEKNVRQGLSAAMNSVSERNASDVVAQLLSVPETLKPGESALDLMISIPQAQDLAKSEIKSSYVELLKTLAVDSATAELIAARLAELTRQYPDDLSIAILDAAWQLQNNSDTAAQAVQNLLVLTSDHRLEDIPEGRRPNSRQRREAAKLLPLWLAAQACIGKPDLHQDGVKLAEISRAAAARQLGIKDSSAVLYHWGKVLLDAGYKEEAEARWSELLDLATQRPGRRKLDSSDKTSWLRSKSAPLATPLVTTFGARLAAAPYSLLAVLQPPVGIPPAARPSTAQGAKAAGQVPDADENNPAHIAPLTLSQFRTVMAVSQATAEGHMFELSLRAVSESLRGGFPVADPVAIDLNASPNRVIRSSSSDNVDVDPIESEVVSSLESVLQVWSREDFPSDETYKILKSLVLPASHPQEIRLYLSAPDLTDAKVKSLAEPLVAAAVQAGQIDDLQKALVQRQATPQAQLASAALNVLIGLQQNSSQAAQEPLQQITSQPLDSMSSQDRLVAFLAALRAFESPELKETAFPILRQMLHLAMQLQGSQSRDISVAGKLATLVNRHLAESGDEKAVFEYFDQLLIGRQSQYSSNAEYGLYMQRSDLVNLAQQASELDMAAVAINYLGRAVDFEETRYGSPDFGNPLATVIRQLRSVPPQERYAAWLKWTMPIEGRQTLRALHQVHSVARVPRAFTTENRPYDTQLQDALLSNFSELVDAAQQADQLAELRAVVQPLVDAKMKSADVLLALILIAQEDVDAGIPLVQSLRATFTDRMKAEAEANNNNRGQSVSVLADYLVFRACLQSPVFVSLYEDQLPQFRRQLQQQSAVSVLQTINLDWASRAASPFVPDLHSPSDLFAHWIPVGGGSGGGQPQPWWAVYQDQLVSLNGPYESKLQFRYPLIGDNFTIEMDYFDDGRAVGSASFGGVLVTPAAAGGPASVRSLSGHESMSRRGVLKRGHASGDRLTIEVSQGVIRHLLNNRLIYQEAVAPTSPWLILHTSGSHMSAYRNLRIQGDVAIPTTVPLIHGNHMDGWRCDTFGDSQPRKRLMKETPTSENDSVAYYQQQEPTVFDWNAVDGVLQGRAIESATPDQQSWINYHRPLQDGESIEYEFFYKPGATVAHPTIGQVALLLEPAGVVSHWIATRQDESSHAIKPDNAIVEADIRRGPEQLPLKSDDWNSVQLRVQGDVATVTLNGAIVCERVLEPELNRQFGIFRYKEQASQVRNIALRGDWPETVPTGEEMLALTRPSTPESILSVATIEDDTLVAPLAGDVVAAARSMPADAAYDYLLQWVLPSATHSNIRLHTAQVPLDADAEADEFGFGAIVAPAVELVRLAVQLNKVESLGNAIDHAVANSPDQRRAALALNAIIALEADLDATIPGLLNEAWDSVLKPYSPGSSARERTAEFLVAWRAGQHASYWFIGSDIARKLRDYERNDEAASGDSDFKRQVHALVGAIDRKARSLPVDSSRDSSRDKSRDTTASRSQWTSVPYLKPEHRWAGYRSSTWTLAKGSAVHLPADIWSQLFFQSPLTGKFEILASRSTHGHQELSIAWGMHSAEPLYDLKGVSVTKLMHSSKDVSKEIQLPVWDQQAEFRIVVDGHKVTTWTNGVQIHEQIFDRQPDPWLLLQSRNASDFSRLSDLRIVGTPEIPAEIDLINIAGLASWRADIYNEWFRTEEDSDSNQNVPWRRVGEELLGQLDKQTTIEFRESLLMYQRPMLEDGEIEFETWYEPGVFEVHPALGSQAFMLTEQGVKLHRLTDAQYETHGLTADNLETIPQATDSLQLKPKDWNHIRLTLRGDLLTIAVNGDEAATVQIDEQPNLRQFGLFRYSNLTQARVRKLLYRGEWPKELPSLKEQQLSAVGEVEEFAGARTTLDADLSQSESELESTHLTFRGLADRRHTSEAGLTLNLHDIKDWGDSPGIAFKEPIEGDCEVTIAYRNLDLTPQKSGWGVALVLEVELDDLQKTSVRSNLSLDVNQQTQHVTEVSRNHAGDESHAIDQQVLHPGNRSGRLRIVRRGGQMDYYIAADGAEEYRHLNSIAVGPAKIRQVACTALSSDDVAKLDVTLTRLTILQP